jgi:hypothetical protein
MKMYDYLVAYNFEADGYLTHSTGTMCVSRKNKINSFEEVTSLVKFITEQIPGAKNVSIYNFILLGRNEH